MTQAPALDVYHRMGHGFVTAGGGLAWSFVGDTALQLNVNAMLMIPSGFALEPSIGLTTAL